jgi:uncharacterized protein YjbJ (UPF0337 family)
MQPASFVTPIGSPIFGCPEERIPEASSNMNKDRIAGAAKQAKGAIEEVAGKVLGDAKLVAEGKADKTEGKVQNAIGGLKDVVKK